MVSRISEGVKVSVETFYQHSFSNPMLSEYVFAYSITIENYNHFPVKLHSRRWYIFDSNCEFREVEGEGVVGVQPVINSGENYRYTSSCNLKSEMGRMYGIYMMENLETKETFEVNIPVFEMIASFKYN